MNWLTIGIVLFILGVLFGVLTTYYLLRERAKGWFQEWKTEHEDKVRKDALKRSRAALKGRVGEQMAPLFPIFEYEPSDARFIGSPVDYIIFEGHSKENPKSITFADVKTGKSAKLTPKQKEFKEIIDKGKVDWETIHLDEMDQEG